MSQFYRIAGLTVQMDTFGRTLAQAEPFRVPAEEPDICISGDLQTYREKFPGFSDDEWEHTRTCESFYTQLMRHNGMLLHSSAVVLEGKAYLFTAPSGTGKSTHTGLWRRELGAELLNDDKPALHLEDGIWYAYGTPWCGKSARSRNLRAPVGGIALLERGTENRITRVGGMTAIRAILSQTLRAKDGSGRLTQMELLDSLLRRVPVWKLQCNTEPEAAKVAYEAMSGKNGGNET